jgi:hypothetical protein
MLNTLGRLTLGGKVPSFIPQFPGQAFPFIDFYMEDPVGTPLPRFIFTREGGHFALTWMSANGVSAHDVIAIDKDANEVEINANQLAPGSDGQFLGETLTPRRWDGSRLINLSGSQMADVLLLDGTRTMTGNLDVGTKGLVTTNLGIYEFTSTMLMVRNRANTAWRDLGVSSLSFRTAYGGFGCNASPIYFAANAASGGVVYFRTYYPTTYDVAKFVDGYFQIMRSGDIDLIDDKFIKIGKDSDGTLPTASADYRGKMIRVEGGAGVADTLYVCMKKADDTYAWIPVASG